MSRRGDETASGDAPVLPARRRHPAAARARGFTLVEVLAALLVLSLVVAGLGQGLRFGMLAWGGATRASASADALDAVDRALRHMVAQADPGTEAKAAPFAGGPARLAMVSRLPPLPGLPEHRVEAVLALEGQRLVLRWRPHLHARPLRPPPPFAETTLLRDLARMDLAYWSPATGWTSAWSAAELPAMVRIRLAFRDSSRRRWSDIVAAPELRRP
jgi:general secretion pathway protein J